MTITQHRLAHSRYHCSQKRLQCLNDESKASSVVAGVSAQLYAQREKRTFAIQIDVVGGNCKERHFPVSGTLSSRLGRIDNLFREHREIFLTRLPSTWKVRRSPPFIPSCFCRRTELVSISGWLCCVPGRYISLAGLTGQSDYKRSNLLYSSVLYFMNCDLSTGNS